MFVTPAGASDSFLTRSSAIEYIGLFFDRCNVQFVLSDGSTAVMNRPDDKAVPVACSLEEASDWIRLARDAGDPSKSHVFVRICFSVSFAGTVTRFFSLSNLTY